MQQVPAVETIDLTKAYNGNVVVDKLNLRINEGETFGFLGPNGAGKTTTILMLLGLTEPTSGVTRVCGYNSTREPLKVKRIVGYIPEKVGFYEDLSAHYNLVYMARLNGLPDEEIEKRIGEALEFVGLANVAKQRVQTFSRGMKQRLAIADVLVKMPKIAFLDEPTSGIDPEGIREMLDMIGKIARERKMTIIMSSHQLHQVQQICHRVGIMIKGKMVVEGALDQLGREALGGGQYQIEVKVAEITSAIVDSIKRIEGVVNVQRSGDLLLVSCQKDLGPQIAKAIVDNNGLLLQMKVQSYALEDIYRKYFTEAGG
jgi:ABC-2 type transport system ATP-binding protein